MRHKILTALCLIALVSLGVGSVKAWHTKVAQDNVAAIKAHAAAVWHDQQLKAQKAGEQQRIKDECTKEKSYYTTLTPAQRAKQAAPNCDLEIVQ